MGLAVLLVAKASPGLAGVAPTSVETPDPRERMDVWAGRWDDVGEVKETAYSHAAPFHKSVTCGWTGDRGFMVCEYRDVGVPPGETADNLSIYTYDEVAKAFRNYGIGNHRVTDTPVVVEGNVWRCVHQETTKSGAKLEFRDTYEFVSPTKRLTRIEISSDGGQHWILIANEIETRTS
jgi:hypothetical protein